ncbi:MAG: DUF2079 domain-containing protein [Candidatus Hydrogenedentota bacterium]
MIRAERFFRRPGILLCLPPVLLAPYLLFAIRGGIPVQLPGFLAVTCCILAVATFILTRAGARAALERHEQFFVWVGSFLFFLAAWKFGSALNPGAVGPEAYNFHQELLDVEQGGFFTHPSEHRTEFAIHFSPVLLLLVPLFHLHPHPDTIFAIGSLVMSLAIPLAWRFLRMKWSPSSAALLAFGAGLYPSLLSLHGDFSPVRFAPPAIWFLLIAYRRRRPVLLGIAVISCWMVKETVLLAVVMLAAVAFVERRGARWYGPLGLAGIGLFLLTNQWILPWFAGTAGKTSTIAAQFGYWGQSAPAVLAGFLGDPVSVARAIFRLNNLAYVLKLGHSVMFLLPLGSPLLLLACPEFFVNAIAGYYPGLIEVSRPGPWTSLVGHYSATIGTVIWAAATEAWAVKCGDSNSGTEEEEWSRARLLFLAVIASIIYPTNAESL